jgi:hypothetical protein
LSQAACIVQQEYPKRSVLFERGDPARMLRFAKRGNLRISHAPDRLAELSKMVKAGPGVDGQCVVAPAVAAKGSLRPSDEQSALTRYC